MEAKASAAIASDIGKYSAHLRKPAQIKADQVAR